MLYVLAVSRVIGIVLLVILAVVILILVVPVTYILDVDLDGRRGALKIYWLFRLVRFRFRLDEELELVLSILFFEIDFLGEDWRERRRLRKLKREEKRKIKAEEKKEKTGRRILRMARSATHVINLLQKHEVWDEALPLFQLFFFRTRPRDIHGNVSFGMSDPSQTGMIIGAVSAFPVIYRTDLVISPDFEAEKAYIAGDIYAKGHMLMLHFIFLLIGLIRRRSFRMFIRELRNHN